MSRVNQFKVLYTSKALDLVCTHAILSFTIYAGNSWGYVQGGCDGLKILNFHIQCDPVHIVVESKKILK